MADQTRNKNVITRLEEKRKKKRGNRNLLPAITHTISSPLHTKNGAVSLGLQTTTLPFVVFHGGTNLERAV